MNDFTHFRKWLDRFPISDETKGDIVSRTKRGLHYVDIKPLMTDERIRYLLYSSSLETSTSVRSQIFGALKKYRDFVTKEQQLSLPRSPEAPNSPG